MPYALLTYTPYSSLRHQDCLATQSRPRVCKPLPSPNVRQPNSPHRCRQRCHSRGSRKPRGAPKWVEIQRVNWCKKSLKTPKLQNCKFHRGRKFPQQLTGPLSASASGWPAMSDPASQDLRTLRLAVQVNGCVGGGLLSQHTPLKRPQATYLTTLRGRSLL